MTVPQFNRRQLSSFLFLHSLRRFHCLHLLHITVLSAYLWFRRVYASSVTCQSPVASLAQRHHAVQQVSSSSETTRPTSYKGLRARCRMSTTPSL